VEKGKGLLEFYADIELSMNLKIWEFENG